MIAVAELEHLVESTIPGARATARDLTGTQDHYELIVVSPTFVGQSTLERHREVYAALTEPLKGPLHAVALKTMTPDEASR